MKIITQEEKNEHRQYVLMQGLKGCLAGAAVGVGLLQLLRYKRPVKFHQMSISVKAAIFSMPTIGLGAFVADQGSVKFDEQKYRSGYLKQVEDEQQATYDKLSSMDKILHRLNENKYKLVVGAWAASLYGAWTLVNRDRYMTRTQKLVQARVYAQGITVVLLLGTILLSMHEEELKKSQPQPVPEWKKHLQEQGKI
ncbi:uncharacterized protein LODBEIA_P09670 [Lodderomyces beijingensis]|uniref:HIG1 domain-containing protein n=1 Tax=Lodderomyces beijingensis TaxID=1775926 RepID=A0ABP0ZF16_9ASCO